MRSSRKQLLLAFYSSSSQLIKVWIYQHWNVCPHIRCRNTPWLAYNIQQYAKLWLTHTHTITYNRKFRWFFFLLSFVNGIIWNDLLIFLFYYMNIEHLFDSITPQESIIICHTQHKKFFAHFFFFFRLLKLLQWHGQFI